jgi:3alpha(or 20beta)-hydroxysteroid dehydrogenase
MRLMAVTDRARLTGSVAIVSGGARGIGAATARLFVAEGAQVVVGDLLVDRGKELADELGPDAVFCELDVRDPDSWQACVDSARANFGRPTVLVNNAGVNFAGSLAQTTADDLRRLFEVNVVGAHLGIQAVVADMQAAGRGSIVIVSSTTGLVALAGNGGYAISKAANAMLARSAAVELGRFGIRVNSVHPGGVDTEMRRGLPIADEEARQAWYRRLPISRIGTAEEVAQTICFLASDESSLATGAQFVIDCGQLAGSTGI